MLSQIALMPIFGYPAIMYGGLTTLALVLLTAFIGWRTVRGKCKFKNPMKVHQIIALLAILLGLGHGLLGLAMILGF
jgi:hypothetical protein